MRSVRFIFSILMVALWSCAPEVEKKPVNIVWPPSPAEPKIELVEIISSEDDVKAEAEGGWLKSLIGDEKGFEGRLMRPYGVAVDRDGRIYVTDAGRVFIFDKKNKNLSFIVEKLGSERLKMPIGVAIGPDGRVYVSDATSDRVFIYNRECKCIGAIGSAGEFRSPAGLAIDTVRGSLYVADTKKHSVRAYTLDGKFLFSLGEHDSDKGRFSFPTNIAVDSEGKIYVVDTGHFRVQVFNPDGKFFGTIEGGRPSLFARPKGIAIDSEGHIYVVDAASQKIYILNKEGELFLSIGGGGIEPGKFSVPAGIAVDAEDRIYVADQLNARVQVFQYLSEKWKAMQPRRK